MDIIKFPSKAKERIYKQFPPLSLNEAPHRYEIRVIEHGIEKIDEYHVIFWHRLLRTIYQAPLEIECELREENQAINNPQTAIFRRLENKSEWQVLGTSQENLTKIHAQEMKPHPVSWKYFIKLPSGGIIQIGTKDQNTKLFVAHVISSQFKDEDDEEAKKFIALLLEEAKKEANNKLFDPLKEFNNTDGLKLYHIFNVYRANYVSGNFMLTEALTQEETLRDEMLKYDTRTDYYDEEKMDHIDRFMLAKGMYFSSAITFFFMALEGFINIIFHSFLKGSLRGRDLNIEERFDIEQKLKLMPALCDGFIQKSTNSMNKIFLKFRELKDFRNSLFHAKVEDALKSFAFIEGGFFIIAI